MYKYNGGILKLLAHGKNRWQRIYKWVDHTLHTGPTFRSRFTKKTNKYFMSGFGTMFFFTLFLRVNFRTLSTLWVLCRFEREEGEDCCCTKRKHARLSVCAIVLKWEHRCRGTNVELFAYNDYGQLNPPHDSWNMGQPQHSIFCCFKDIIRSKLWFWPKPFLWLHRVEICRDRHDRRSCKICASCVNFTGKQCNFSHNLRRTTKFTHTKWDFALKLLKFHTLN